MRESQVWEAVAHIGGTLEKRPSNIAFGNFPVQRASLEETLTAWSANMQSSAILSKLLPSQYSSTWKSLELASEYAAQ